MAREQLCVNCVGNKVNQILQYKPEYTSADRFAVAALMQRRDRRLPVRLD
jgi:hypothetical protein